MSDNRYALESPEERRERRACGGSYTRTDPNQHGLKFVRVLFPASELRDVGIVGSDRGIYRASVPLRREDQMPDGLKAEDVDADQLFRQIRDCRFPDVIRRRDPVPRFAGGSFTKIDKKKPNMSFAPVKLVKDETRHEVAVIGADGAIYRGIRTDPRKSIVLDRKLRGTGRPVRIRVDPGSGRDLLIPSTVTLHENGTPTSGLGLAVMVPDVQVATLELENYLKFVQQQHESTGRVEPQSTEGVEPQSTEREEQDSTVREEHDTTVHEEQDTKEREGQDSTERVEPETTEPEEPDPMELEEYEFTEDPDHAFI